MKKGQALLLSVLFTSLFITLSVLFTRMIYNGFAGAYAAAERQAAFYLAEAGLEKGKVELAHNPHWYTDLPYYLEDNSNWLVNYAVGQVNPLGEGSFKTIREKDKSWLYAVGFKGEAVAVLKLVFSNPPFKAIAWSEL